MIVVLFWLVLWCYVWVSVVVCGLKLVGSVSVSWCW